LKNKLRQHIEEIIPLTDEEFDFVQAHFKLITLKKHQYLIQENTFINNDFWVIEGLLKASFTDENGKEHILQFAMENWWITDYQAYFNGIKTIINVDCIETAKVYSLSLSDRENICNNLHKMANFFRIKSSNGYVALQDRILTLLSSNSKERYNLFLKKYPQLFQRVPKSLIAAYLGVSRETLSRLNKK